MFTPPTGDWTVQFLNHIFGMGWQTMYLNGGGGSQNVLASVMGSFNRIAFIVMALFYSYTAIISAYSTAHEGVALGKKYHWAYTPIRGMIGFGLLAPIGPNGLCLLQGLVLMFVYSGIGLADNLWNQTLTYLQSNGGSISTVSYENPRDLSNQILLSLVVKEYLNQNNTGTSQTAFKPTVCSSDPTCLYISNNMATPQWNQQTFDYVSTFNADGITPGAIGTIRVSCPYAVASATGLMGQATHASVGYQAYCSAKQQATQHLILSLDKLAVAIVSVESTTGNMKPADPALINQAIAQYQTDIGTAVSSFSATFNGPLAQDYATFVNAAQAQGWASAGAWYLQIARINNEVAESIGSVPTATGPITSQLSGAKLADLPPLITATKNIESQAQGNGGYISDNVSDSATAANASFIMRFIDNASDFLKQGIANIETTMVSSVTSGSDPISNLQSIGNTIDTITSGSIVAVIGISLIATHAVGSAPLNLIFGLLKLFYIPGMALAYLLPFIPFAIWTMAVVGWVILVIESWIAAPIWAIAHGMPEGEGFIGQHARQGYMLFFSILFKPALLIIGYFASLLLVSAILPFVALGFGVFLHAEANNQGLIFFMISSVAYLTMFAALCLVIVRYCFKLITWVPDNILRWIGNNVQPLVRDSDVSGAGRSGLVGAGAVGGLMAAGADRFSPQSRQRLADKNSAQSSRQLWDEKNTAQRDLAIVQKEQITGGGNKLKTGGGGGGSPAGGGSSGRSLPDTPLTGDTPAGNASIDLGVRAPAEGTTEHPAKVEIPMDVLAQDEQQIASEEQSRPDVEPTI